MHDDATGAIGFIFARGGSKGVLRKNLRLLGGKPLIARSIEVALACRGLKTVIVSTEDDEIAEVAKGLGAEVPFRRPAALASDTAPEWLAWRHAVEWVEAERGPFGIFVSLPATSPFRDVGDVDACINLLREDPHADVVITVKEAERSPYFNMVRLDADGYACLVIPPASKIARRQDAPSIYDITTVAYAARPAFIRQANGLFDGRVRTVVVAPERALDIDTPHDFAIAECLAKERWP